MSIQGIYAASMSIFSDDLSLNIRETINHAENLITKGCNGVVLFGSTGQAQLISTKEKISLIEEASASLQKKNFVIGTGTNSLKETITLMKHSKENGFNHFLLMPPAYYKYGDSGAYSFYAKVIDEIPDSKIILYNFEKLCGYAFSIKIVEQLVKDFPDQICGVKDSTKNLYDQLKIENFSVMPGSEAHLLKGLKIGCSGIISAVTNVTAALSRKIYEDYKKGKVLDEDNNLLINVRAVFDKYDLISALHTYKNEENTIYKNVLPPLELLNDKNKKNLFKELEELKFRRAA